MAELSGEQPRLPHWGRCRQTEGDKTKRGEAQGVPGVVLTVATQAPRQALCVLHNLPV